MAEPELTNKSDVNIDDIIKNAVGDKPATVQGAFDNEMLSRVSDLIGGKREALHKDMFGDQAISRQDNEELSDDELAADPSEEEIEAALDSEESDEAMDLIDLVTRMEEEE